MKDKARIALLKKLNNVFKIEGLDLGTINLDISPNDSIFSREQHYFGVGFSALHCILQALSSAQKDKAEIKTILDFPSGWGRVLRFLKAYFPQSSITACELDEDALNFCREQLKVNTLMSHEDFSKIEIKHRFDLIWSGSLVTHLSEERTKKLLDFFFNALNDKGLLIFTSHGRNTEILLENEINTYGLSDSQRVDLLRQYETAGYGYINYNEFADYGMSLSKPSWLIKFLEDNYEVKVVSYTEKGWDNHQDVIACVKESLFSHAFQHTPQKKEQKPTHIINSSKDQKRVFGYSLQGHKRIVNHFTGEDIAHQTPFERVIKTLASKPGFRWLCRFSGLGK